MDKLIKSMKNIIQKTGEKIRKENRCLAERGIPEHSHFEIKFKDDSLRNEQDTNWSEISTEKDVLYGKVLKTVRVCKYPVKSIKVCHGNHVIRVDIKDGEEIYQAIKSRVVFVPGRGEITKMTGRIVGVVKDNKIIEEQCIDLLSDTIVGFRF